MMDSGLKRKTPKPSPKLHTRNLKTSVRSTPEGDSINQKSVFKLQKTPRREKNKQVLSGQEHVQLTSGVCTPAGSSRKKKAKKHKLSGNESTVLNVSVASKRSCLSDESEYDVDAPVTDDSLSVPTSPPGKMKLAKKSPKRKASTEERLDETDVSWEKAVQQARGMPDGALAEEESLPSKEQHQAEKATSSGKVKSPQGKKSKFEKGKKKPFDVSIELGLEA